MYRNELSEIFDESVIGARRTFLEKQKHDPFCSAQLWENVIADTLGGTVTPWKCGWDIDVCIWGKSCKIEVKFSKAFYATFSQIRYNNCNRNIFKCGGLRKDSADAYLMIGLDVDDGIYVFAFHNSAIQGRSTTLSITAPSSAKTTAVMDGLSIPFHDILPCVARICHEVDLLSENPQFEFD